MYLSTALSLPIETVLRPAAGRLHRGGVFVLWTRLATLAACGGFAAVWDLRTRTIPDAAWIGGLAAALLLAVAGGPGARWAALGGAGIAALAFAPALMIRTGGQPVLPLADWCLAVAFGALAGLATLAAVTLAAGLGLVLGLALLVRGRHDARPPYAPVLALAFVTATAFPLLAR